MPDIQRHFTPSQLFSVAFGSVIGVAWIPFVGYWLETAGAIGALLAFAAGCITVLFIVAAYVEIGSMYPVNGGEAAYAQIALGDSFAFVAGWMLVLLYLGFTSFEMIALGWITCILFPALKGPPLYTILGSPVHVGELGVGLGTAVLIHWLNVRSHTSAARFQTLLSWGLIAFAMFVLAAALAYGSSAHLAPAFASPPGGGPIEGVFTIFSISLLFYGGFNFTSQMLGERDSGVTPRQVAAAMFLSVIVAFFFYAAIILSAGLLMPRAELLTLELPAATMFRIAFDSQLLFASVLVVGIVGLVTSWNGAVFAGSRLLAKLSEMRLLPVAIGRFDPVSGTPKRAVLALSIVTPLIAAIGQGGIVPLSKALSFSIAVAWAITVLSVIRLRIAQPDAERPYKVAQAPLVLGIAVLGMLFGVFVTGRGFVTSAGLTPDGIMITLWVFLGFIVRQLTRRGTMSVSATQ